MVALDKTQKIFTAKYLLQLHSLPHIKFRLHNYTDFVNALQSSILYILLFEEPESRQDIAEILEISGLTRIYKIQTGPHSTLHSSKLNP